MTIAFQTIAGYNYGAQQYDRVLAMVKLGIFSSLSYGFCVSAIMLLVPELIIGIFTQNSALLTTTASIAFWSFCCFLYPTHTVSLALYFKPSVRLVRRFFYRH